MLDVYMIIVLLVMAALMTGVLLWAGKTIDEGSEQG